MTQQISIDSGVKKKSLPIAGQELDIDAELRKFEDEERARLGLAVEQQWVEDMANLMFTKSEKSKITLLIGGLTMAHDYLVSGAFSSLGYNTIPLDPPNYDALSVGKEFGNKSQCNPTYFTVGNLVQYLIHLRDKRGLATQEIIDKYVFLTAGACGPCRFGMYVTEYRKALRDAGFDGFRVMLFQQQGGLSQATGEASGLELNPPFFIGLLKSLIAGDVINGIGYRLRPYEKVPGATDKAIAEAKDICRDALLHKKSILRALLRSKEVFKKVEVDRTIPKPKVSIIGEFWAMTTEGDGNYQLQRFIEKEGAECDIQFVTAWILYNIWEVRFDTASRAVLRGMDKSKYGLAGSGEYGVFTRKIGLWAGDKALRAAFQTFAYAGGFYGYSLPDMDAVAEVAAPYYNNDLRGGEGHMEVGKLILNVVKSKATMTLSVKPFGCMPSSGVSDGVQSLINEKFPGTIFCAVETSGDGAVNFQSRVQMYLFKARQAAQAEFDKALEETGLTLEKLRAFLNENPKYGAALHRAPHYAAATGADLVHEVAEVYGKSKLELAMRGARSFATAVIEGARETVTTAPKRAEKTAALVREASKELLEIAKEMGPSVAQSALQSARAKLAEVLPFVKANEEAMPVAAE
ncbi:MAG TPA: 2-hydroxyglutaryl-CoA dehydratase [Polyangiaceae bacterium]|jgi:predicted nucleotide-binding protein (sugar kinase/HSP70/actin superfamily)